MTISLISSTVRVCAEPTDDGECAAEVFTGMRKATAVNIITDYINNTCEKILDCTAVFKNDKIGQDHFDKFIMSVIG